MQESVYMRPEMKFHFAMKKLIFTLFFIADEMKCNIVSREVGVKRPIKKCKQPERDIETSMLETIMHKFIEEVLRQIKQQLIKITIF